MKGVIKCDVGKRGRIFAFKSPAAAMQEQPHVEPMVDVYFIGEADNLAFKHVPLSHVVHTASYVSPSGNAPASGTEDDTEPLSGRVRMTLGILQGVVLPSGASDQPGSQAVESSESESEAESNASDKSAAVAKSWLQQQLGGNRPVA